VRTDVVVSVATATTSHVAVAFEKDAKSAAVRKKKTVTVTVTETKTAKMVAAVTGLREQAKIARRKKPPMAVFVLTSDTIKHILNVE